MGDAEQVGGLVRQPRQRDPYLTEILPRLYATGCREPDVRNEPPDTVAIAGKAGGEFTFLADGSDLASGASAVR